MREDAAAAFQRARYYQGELDEIYRYYLPFRRSTIEQSMDRGTGTEGTSRSDHLFDGTGVSAAMTFTGSMMSDWMPPQEDFFTLEAGPIIPEGDAKKKMNEILAGITRVLHGVLEGRPRLAAQEAFSDLFAGTCALYMPQGDARHPVKARAVPIIEIALDEGPDGDVEEIWWKRKWKARHIPQQWPNGKISDELAKCIKDHPNELVEVCQYTYYDRTRGEEKWRLAVWTAKDKNDDSLLHEEEFRVSPWVIGRFFKVPGETFGRGLAHLGLPFVKTANKTRELALTAAAFAVLGLWLRRNDLSFNPDTARMEPGAMWQVSSTGGSLGPSITRLDVPHNFDVASIVMADEREQIKRVLMDDELPDDMDPVKSATEIAGRIKRFARRHGGVSSRIALEVITPIVQRGVDRLEQAKLLNIPAPAGGKEATRITIDNLVTRVRVIAPAATGYRADKVERLTNWMQMTVMLLGPQAAMLAARVEEAIPRMGRWLGIDEDLIRSQGEIKELQQQIAKMAAAAQQQDAGPAPPDQEQLRQSLVNGSTF